MKTVGYFNGKIGELDELYIPFNERTHYFGDGVYDATSAGNHVPFAMQDHIDRFYNSAKLVDIDVGMAKEELTELICSLTKKLDSPQSQVYWQVTRGTAMRNHVFPDVHSNLWIMIRPFPRVNLDRKESAITYPDRRFFYCNVKTLNLMPNCLAAEAAKKAGCDEAIFYREPALLAGVSADSPFILEEGGKLKGRVTECAHSNVHILKDGVFQTAPLDNLILPGIARKHLIAKCRELGVPVSETPFSVEEMYNADEVMVSSASTFGISLKSIDGRPVGGKAQDLLKKIQIAVMDEFDAETGK
jgi:D-alanine transaminase